MTTIHLSDLHGQFVRIAPKGSSTSTHVAFERFGVLTDLGSPTRFGLIDEEGDTRAYPADEFGVRPWARRRVHVFWYRRTWTWCREVDGEVLDYFEGLPRYSSHGEALEHSLVWLAKVSKRRAVATGGDGR